MTSQTAWHAVAEFWPRAETSRFVQVGNIDFHVQISGAGDDVLLLQAPAPPATPFAGPPPSRTKPHRVFPPA